MAVLYWKRESLTWKAGTYMDTKAYIKIFLKCWILRPRHQISPAWNANCFRNNVLFCWIYSIALHKWTHMLGNVCVYTYTYRSHNWSHRTQNNVLTCNSHWIGHILRLRPYRCIFWCSSNPRYQQDILNKTNANGCFCPEHRQSHYVILCYIFVKHRLTEIFDYPEFPRSAEIESYSLW